MGRVNRLFRVTFTTVLLSLTMVLSVAVRPCMGENAKPTLKQPSPTRKVLTVDEARMIVKDIPSVDIKTTLSRWKLSEPELVQLRSWSDQLVENPARTDFLPKWRALIQQVSQRNPLIGSQEVTSLIRMIMLAAYEAAQKYTDSAPDSNATESVYQELQRRLRSSITQARQLKALAVTEQRNPTFGSQISAPAYQRTFQKCEVGDAQKPQLKCEERLISTTHELDDFISSSEAAIQKTEELMKHRNAGSTNQGEKRRNILYSLSDVAKEMHDSAMNTMSTKRS